MLYTIFIGLLIIYKISAQSTNNLTGYNEDADAYYPYEDWSDTFDWKLFKTFCTLPEYDNILLSPISLKLLLALLYEGSGGLTELEFQNVMQFSTKKQVIRENFHQILTALQASERREYILNLGTRIFLHSDMQPQQNFATKALHNYETNIEPTNFSNPIVATNTINSWIDKLTNGRIQQLVKPDDIKDAIMVLTNSIFFKGTWRHQFPKNSTTLGGFYLTPRKIVNVSYMTTTDNFFYHESNDLDAKILRLPYKGQRYSMFIVLPNSKGGLPHLINKINLQILKQQLYLMNEVPVEVSIPKFKFNFETNFNKILQDFGLKQMFQNTANFPGIVRGNTNVLRMLVVSDILQKSGIEINEEGSVVYASTAIQIGNKFGETDNIFNATHPFLFFIEEQTHGTILFVGKMVNPLQTDTIPLSSLINENPLEQSTVIPLPLPQTASAQTLANYPNLQPASEKPETIIRRFNYFDLELLNEFNELSGNILISPANIKTTLALILEGARGKCAQEINNALRINDINNKEIREVLSQLLFDLNDDTNLIASNAIFVSDKFKIINEYKNKVEKYYKANVRNLDFTNINEAIKIINYWTSNTTHGLIKEIVNSQNLFAETTIVLASTLYFKGIWKTAFNPRNTKIQCFQSPTRGCVNTPLMLVSDNFNYDLIQELNAHVVELPYKDDKYSMLVILPLENNNMKILTKDLQHVRFNSILNQLKPTDLIVELPKFEIDFNTDLVEFLKILKIKEIFDSNANLTGIIPQENIKINNIAHKTRIEVNEDGTKAAAASAAIVIPLMGSITQRLTINRPFIFFIYHKESRNIIFEGIFTEPNEYINTGTSRLLKHRNLGQRYRQYHK